MLKKILSLTMAALILVSVFAACGSGNSSSSTTSTTSTESSEASETGVNFDEEPYEINFMYMVAQEGSGQEAVNKAVNELTLKELNMTVNMMPMTFGTYNSQIAMILAANEPLDVLPIMFNQVPTYIESQYIVNANDYSQYITDIISVMGEEDAYAGTVGDFLVGFTQMKERSYPAGLVVRKDIFEELGYSVDDFNVTVDDMASFDKITEMFAKVKEAYPDMVAFDGTSVMGLQTMSYRDTLGENMGFGSLENYGQTTTVTNYYESQQFIDFCNIGREWFTKGYSSQDVAVNTDSGEIKMKAGNTFSYMTNVKPNTDIEKLAQTGYEVVVIPCSERVKTTNAVTALLLGVANASKDKTKAFQFLNWTYTSKEFNNLINWGIEGTDWVETADGLAAYPDGVDAVSVGYHNDFGFAYPNQFAGTPWEGNPTDIWEQYEVYNSETNTSEAFGFIFDPSSVANEMAQLNSVYEQYYKDLAFGAVEPSEKIDEFNKALYDAGLQKLIDTKQEQLDAWLAAK